MFLKRLQGEIDHIKRLYPQAHYQGLADRAADNWSFLIPNTDSQMIDFYHATEYLADVAKAFHSRAKAQQQQWMDDACHDLKQTMGTAADLLKTMEAIPTAKQTLASDAAGTPRCHHLFSQSSPPNALCRSDGEPYTHWFGGHRSRL